MKTFLKENLILILGITLPLVLAIIFLIANQIVLGSIEPPKYKVLFASYNYASGIQNKTHEIYIKDNQAYLRYNPNKKDNSPTPYSIELYEFSPTSDEIKKLELPDRDLTNNRNEILITSTSSYNISDDKKSPDGYIFSINKSYNGNLMTKVFGGGNRYRNTYALINGQRSVQIPNTENFRNKFVGWIISEKE